MQARGNAIVERVRSMKKYKKLIIAGLALGLLSLTACGFITAYAPKPPEYGVKRLNTLLGQAHRAEAERYATEFLQAAEETWEAAYQEWRRQNQKLMIHRDYSTLLKLISEATGQAEQAAQKSLRIRDSLKTVLRFKIPLVKQRIDSLHAAWGDLPARKSVNVRFATGELLVLESQAAYERGDYLLADQKLSAGEQMIGEAGQKVTEKIREYLSHLPIWRKWAEETIAWSRANNEAAIIVDKLGKTCRVYVGGKLKAEYPAEFGANWMGPKSRRGDRATPEGQYYVKKKRSGAQTIYYKALEINYPNSSDWEKFQEAKKNGQLPQSAGIGGSIEIHGEGGKGINWTEGCVALDNRDMDALFQMVKVGTPVTIVGSLNGLAENQ